MRKQIFLSRQSSWAEVMPHRVPPTLQWSHNDRDGILNHRRLDSVLTRLCRRSSKETSKLRVTGHCEENSLMTGEFPAQRASNAENIYMWWRHNACSNFSLYSRPKTIIIPGIMILVHTLFWFVVVRYTGVVYAPSQWETTLHCNVISHWLREYTQ